MTPNALLAGAVLGRLAGLGVGDWVVCAGARNVPLVASLLARGSGPEGRLWHHFDERTAAFFALGRAKKTGRPAAVLTTSGTAAAELLPAVIEAHYSGLPLVLVTADRPRRFRGSGAPQAIEQAGLFGPYATALDLENPDDLAPVDGWTAEAPLHLNVAFEEPRADDRTHDWKPAGSAPAPAGDDPGPEELVDFCRDREGLIVLLGELPELWREPVSRFLVSLGVPVWAEAGSGLRESSVLVPWLRYGEPPLPGRLLRIGGVPSWRLWRDLEERPGIPLLSVCPRPFSGLARPSRFFLSRSFPDVVLSGGGPTPEAPVLDGSVFERFPRSEPSLVHALSRAIPGEALVFLGNSLPIREWNLFATDDPPHPRCFASRGANGIDGQVATFFGLAVDEPEAWGIFGDLTALYDLNALALLAGTGPGRRRLVVINNGGGRIFSRLPSMAGLDPGEKQVTENRHRFGFAAWAAMWGVEHRLWTAGQPFPKDLSAHVVIEAVPDEAESEAFWNWGKGGR